MHEALLFVVPCHVLLHDLIGDTELGTLRLDECNDGAVKFFEQATIVF